jgi:acyl carrier protein
MKSSNNRREQSSGNEDTNHGKRGTRLTRDQLRADVLEILREKTRKLDTDFSGALTEETRIVGDLDFESVVIVEFCAAIGKHFRTKLPFQSLVFQNGQFQDFNVGQLLTFLEEHLTP